jgi:hypothetical protein
MADLHQHFNEMLVCQLAESVIPFLVRIATGRERLPTGHIVDRDGVYHQTQARSGIEFGAESPPQRRRRGSPKGGPLPFGESVNRAKASADRPATTA